MSYLCVCACGWLCDCRRNKTKLQNNMNFCVWLCDNRENQAHTATTTCPTIVRGPATTTGIQTHRLQNKQIPTFMTLYGCLEIMQRLQNQRCVCLCDGDENQAQTASTTCPTFARGSTTIAKTKQKRQNQHVPPRCASATDAKTNTR